MPVKYSKHSAGPSTRRVVFSPEMIQDLSFYTLSKAELQAEAEKRGLSKTGTKNDLIERLQESE